MVFVIITRNQEKKKGRRHYHEIIGIKKKDIYLYD